MAEKVKINLLNGQHILFRGQFIRPLEIGKVVEKRSTKSTSFLTLSIDPTSLSSAVESDDGEELESIFSSELLFPVFSILEGI
jgi:hypothetical protein